MERLLTPAEAADFLRVNRSTLYTWSSRRQIPAQRVGRALRFSRPDLQAWLDSQRQPAEAYPGGAR